ncbi:hypothetical protein [Pseudodonghicola flavimaris]|uniref:Uncharacterized protein n=1 Tax=Pseudodonghicola flavimaris TaxID=3050036 RepID=A0ABT7EW00_9RHOB|nr:hypothetical protein [Pseudodonghicola flavimaris]MDK3016526.1 hypothetical protein [Pseudodonghicola flavimaris]
MSDLNEAQKSTLERVQKAGGPVVLHVATARALVAKGLIKSDGTKGHGKAKAAYIAA